MVKFLESKLNSSIPCFIGAITFLLICGPGVLNPLNETWLLTGGDLTQQYFGWAFFRNSPWTLPLGLNPMYGMDISSSIVYSDGNPLLSILFKPFNRFLPEIFQFQGLWLAICFVLQAFLAWKILGLYTQDSISKGLGTTFFLLATPMLFRVGLHTNLAAHFLILGGLYLNLRPISKNQAFWWITLLLVSLSVHFYLFAMIFGLWVADLGDRLPPKVDGQSNKNLTGILFTLTFIFVIAWQLGYFSVKAPSLFGYGFFKANLLSLFNANGWSLFIKSIPIKSSWGEANLYLGLGSIMLLLFGVGKISLWHIEAATNLRKYRYLIIVLVFLILFSITNQIGIGSLEFRVPIPEWLLNIFGVLRHSARLFWPVFYALLVIGCILVLKGYSIGKARLIFALCMAVQIVDLSPGLINLHKELNTPFTNDLTSSPLKQPFWKMASTQYQNLYLLPSRSEPSPDFMSRFMSSDWKIFGRYAAAYKLNTNAVYMSRYDTEKQDSAFQKAIQISSKGTFDSKTLYIIKNEDLIPVALGLKDQDTLLATIDGVNVLAPGFLKSTNLDSIGNYSKIDISSIRPNLNQEISFMRPESVLSTYALTKDWNNREDWGAWSKGKEMELILPLPANRADTLTLRLRAFVNGAIPKQIVEVSSDGKILGEYSLSKFDGNLIKLDIPNSAKQNGYMSISLKVPNAASPSSIGMAQDDRVLGIGIISAIFN
jgi:hypothetical protein